jgi:hypothetical protein
MNLKSVSIGDHNSREPNFATLTAQLHCSDSGGVDLVHPVLSVHQSTALHPLGSPIMTNSQSQSKVSGPLIIAGLVLLLLILHQDNWFWTDDTLLMGFMPIGLFWHACISIAATLTWFLATKIAWPHVDNLSHPVGNAENSEGQE